MTVERDVWAAPNPDRSEWVVAPNGLSASGAVLWVIEDDWGHAVEPGIGYTERVGAEDRLEELRNEKIAI